MPIMAILVLGKCSANFGRQILGKALEFPGKRLQKSLPECCFTLDTDFDWLRQKNKPRMANFPIENIAHERCNQRRNDKQLASCHVSSRPMRSLYFPSCYLQNLDRKICIRRKINRKKILILKFSCKISSVVVLLLKIW